MLDFFNTLSDLLQSELVQGNIGKIIIFQIVEIVIVVFLTWICCTKFFLRIKLNQAADKERKFAKMQEKIEALESKNKKLIDQMREYDLLKALDSNESVAFKDSALDQFKRQEKKK